MTSYLKRNKLLISLFVVAAFFGALFIAPQMASASEHTKKVVILHTNDEHGSIENFAKIASIRDQLENSNEYDDIIIVSGGDAFSGNPVVDEYLIDG